MSTTTLPSSLVDSLPASKVTGSLPASQISGLRGRCSSWSERKRRSYKGRVYVASRGS